MPTLWLNLWAASMSRGEKPGFFERSFREIRFDCGLHQGNLGVMSGNMLAFLHQTVQPAHIERGLFHCLMAEKLQEKALVAHSTLNHYRRVSECPFQPRERL